MDLNVIYILFSDSLLHQFWIKKLNSSWTSIQDIINSIGLTPRTTWNTKINTLHAIKYLSWTLNININIIGIREQRTYHNCKYLLYYKFQNSLLKIMRQPTNIDSINVIIYKKKYYLSQTQNIFPILIDLPTSTEITFRNKLITIEQVKDIMSPHTNRNNFPFSIKIYTSYSYLRQKSSHISNNMIGQYISSDNSDDTLYIFVTPTLERNFFYIHKLDKIKNVPFNPIGLFHIPKKVEGDRINHIQTKLPSALNQNYCVCQHEETNCFVPPKRYSHLGMYLRQSFISI